MAGLPPSEGLPLIPLPARSNNNTPILKWILSRPNTHLLPLHLLTSGGTLSDLVERKANDVTARRFKANAGNDAASGGKKKRADDVSDEKQAPTVSAFFSSLPLHHPMHALSQSMIEQQPADAMPLPQTWLEEEREPLSPLGQLLLQPEAADEQQSQLLLRPLQAARRDLAHDLRDRDDSDVVDYEEQRQWHYTPVLPPSPLTAARMLTGAVKEEAGVIRRGVVMNDDAIWKSGVMNDDVIGNDDDDRMTDVIDVVGYDEEEEQQWRPFSPVLPPSPPLATLLTGAVKKEVVGDADDVIQREDGKAKKAVSQPTARRPAVRRKRPAAERPEVIYCKQYLGLAWLHEQRGNRLVMTQQQRGVCSAIMARVSYLLPAEREMLASAIGITQRQVHNVFTNRGGRATQRKAGGTSTEEAQQVIREELLNHGYVLNDVDDSVKKE